jgi:single-strand DNA-binding protein
VKQFLEEITFVGRLGKTPELQHSKISNIPVCTLDVAQKVEGQEDSIWHKVVVWGDQAHYCVNLLKTGVLFFVQGQKYKRSYVARDGNERVIEEIKAKLIGFPKY